MIMSRHSYSREVSLTSPTFEYDSLCHFLENLQCPPQITTWPRSTTFSKDLRKKKFLRIFLLGFNIQLINLYFLIGGMFSLKCK